MGFSRGPKIVTDGLVLALDAGNTKSYPGSGTTWYDLSGNGNNATGVGSPAFESSTNSFIFDGTDDRFAASIASAFDLYCIEIAFKPHKTISSNVGPDGSDYSLLGIQASAGNNNGINVYEWTGGLTNETVSIWSHGGYATAMTTTVSLAFHIMAFNWNGSTYDIWLDGEKQSTAGRTSFGHAQLIAGVSSVDPGYNLGYNYYHSGNIAFVRTYNQSLSDTEVLQNYNATKGRFGL